MKHFKFFKQHSEYESYINSENKLLPNVSYCEDLNDIHSNLLPYITNGLVYHFDGLYKGSDKTKWTDLVSNAYFTFNEHSSVNYNSIILDGSGYLTGNINMSIASNIGTIEVCAEQTVSGSAIIFLSAGTTNLSAIISGSGMCFKAANSGNNQFVLTKTNNFTWSSTNQMCLYNGTKYTALSENNWNNNNTTSTILGARSSNSPYYYFTGKIHAIRIYNRQLSEEEMLFNQQLDNVRFKLNLTI